MTAAVLAEPLWERAVSRRVRGPSNESPEVRGTAISYQAADRLSSLVEAVAETSLPNWDGHGADPVSPLAVYFAHQLLASIPETWPSPEIAVDPDGDVSLEWSNGPRSVLSVSVDSTGMLHYAALFGDTRFHGAEAFVDRLPEAIMHGLSRIHSSRRLPGAAPAR